MTRGWFTAPPVKVIAMSPLLLAVVLNVLSKAASLRSNR
jgi:hypothetical protein